MSEIKCVFLLLLVAFLQTADMHCANSVWQNHQVNKISLNQQPDSSIYVDLCEGDSFLFGGRYEKQSGTYYDTVINSMGYDSVYVLYLTVSQTFHNIEFDTICYGTTYYWHSRQLTQSGVYVDSLRSIEGCDSIIYELHLVVNNVQKAYIPLSICKGYEFITPGGLHLNKAGVYYDTLMVNSLCNVRKYTVTMLPYTIIDDSLEICRGSGARAQNGLYYNVPGDYVDTVNRNPGYACDTVFRTHVYYGYDRITIDTTVCSGQTFRFRGNVYTQSGTDTVIRPSYSQRTCDTLFIINLVVVPTQTTTLNETSCDNSPYFFGGRWLTKSGTYKDTLKSKSCGCDSIVILNLQVKDSAIVDTVVTICEKGVFMWHGKSYVNDGTYYDTLVNVVTGCNEYYTLHLSTYEETKLIAVNGNNNVVEICWDEDEYIITPIYKGGVPSRYSITYDGAKVSAYNNIADDTYDGVSIKVPIPKRENGTRVRPDNYVVQLRIGNEYCNWASQELSFNLLIKYSSDILEQHFNDVVSVLNGIYNGGYYFSGYRWYVNRKKITNMDNSNMYLESLNPGDSVYAELRREGENYFIPTCPIVIDDLGTEEIETPLLKIKQEGNIAYLESKNDASYRLCTMCGVVLERGEIRMNEMCQLYLPYTTGCYFLVVDVNNAYRKVFKIIINR